MCHYGKSKALSPLANWIVIMRDPRHLAQDHQPLVVTATIESSFSMIMLALAILGVGCRPDQSTAPLPQLRGQILVDGQPAAGAIVKLFELPGSFGSGTLPSGTVADSQGRFAIGEHVNETSALPPGTWAVLIAWMKTPDAGGLAEDRLQGRYLDPSKPACKVELKTESIDLGVIRLTRN